MARGAGGSLIASTSNTLLLRTPGAAELSSGDPGVSHGAAGAVGQAEGATASGTGSGGGRG